MSAALHDLKVFDQRTLPPMARRAAQKKIETVAEESVESDIYWRPIIILTALFIFVGLMMVGYTKAKSLIDLPVNEIRILGDTRYLNKSVLAEKLAAGINAPLIDMDIKALHDLVLEDPWVHSAKIRRDWPPAVEVVIDEQIPVARWGAKGLLNHQGDIFWPDESGDYSKLPLLDGPATETQRLMSQYHDLSPMFQGAKIKMVGLSLEARGAWTLTLDNGIQVVVGREQLKERLQRFLNIYQRVLADKADTIERVDIRYTNGVAVKWRAQQNEQPAAQQDERVKAG